jgi:hypothetical protein
MRVLVEATGEVGQRTANVLLAERTVDFIGIWNSAGTRRTARTGPARDVDGFDIAVSDSLTPRPHLIARCAVAGIPIVLWADDAGAAPGAAVAPVVTGANLGSALTAALLSHPTARPEPGEPVRVAWTEPGKPHRRGEQIAFPDPVGVSTAKRRADGRFVARRSDDWAGVVVQVGPDDAPRVVGVADHAAHLEALVLAAATLVTADGAFPPGVHDAADAGEQLLNALTRVELDVASWRSNT